MFVGHFAAGIAASAYDRRLPLWAGIAASQLVDIGWAGLIMVGVEKLRIVPDLPGNPLDLYYMPYTHSLPAALLWGLAAALLARWLLRLPWATAWLGGAVVVSHWFLDVLVHRPDMEIGFTGPKIGLGLWNLPLPEMALEMGLTGLAIGALVATRKDAGQKAWPVLAFFVLLTVLQITGQISKGAEDAVQMGSLALFGYAVAIVGAWLVDRQGRRAV
jgi:uncharacterized membrane protein YhhN